MNKKKNEATDLLFLLSWKLGTSIEKMQRVYNNQRHLRRDRQATRRFLLFFFFTKLLFQVFFFFVRILGRGLSPLFVASHRLAFEEAQQLHD